MTTPYQVAIELLPAYSAGGLDVDQHRDVEALITDYIDDQLDVESKAAFDRVMEGRCRSSPRSREGQAW